ncbi:MAG: hypothetical protein KDC46_12445 [Thermoleophilia bacterium]|nr:hypothetical protein [Thermoleophilia bacterium]
MTTTTGIAMWRRILLIAITALVGALAVSFSQPAKAEAFVNPSVVFPSTEGWVYVKSDLPQACPAVWPTPSYCYKAPAKTAWRWTGSTWKQTSIAGGTQVYALPYASGWHWVWIDRRTGWLAIRTSDLTTGRTCPPGAFC